MRSFWITSAVATAALALGACQDKRRPEPVPPPQSGLQQGGVSGRAAPAGVSEISWFQGTLDEAFASRPCPAHRRAMLSF